MYGKYISGTPAHTHYIHHWQYHCCDNDYKDNIYQTSRNTLAMQCSLFVKIYPQKKRYLSSWKRQAVNTVICQYIFKLCRAECKSAHQWRFLQFPRPAN